jgi:thiol-disulfide isomerase/thioredoxin
VIGLSEFQGQVVVLNFWASWCVPCRQEMPTLERLWQEFRHRGVVTLGVNVADEFDEAAVFLKQLRITYANVYDPEQVRLQAYQVTGLPTTVFLDTQLRILERVSGGYSGEAGYQQLREQVLKFTSASR